MITKSPSVQKKIRHAKNRGRPMKRRNGRDINEDNLTELERSILDFMKDTGEPISVRDIATELFGSDVAAEAKGRDSVRTVRNALRIPKAMDLISQSDGTGTYTITERYRKWGLKAAEKTAAAWKLERERRRMEGIE